MSKRKQTNTQQLITFGLGATEEGLNSAIESLTAIRDSKFPKTPAKASRKARTDKGVQRGLPKGIGGALPKDLPKPNGGDTDASTTE